MPGIMDLIQPGAGGSAAQRGPGGQTWAGKYITHDPKDTRTVVDMYKQSAREAGINDISQATPDQIRQWQAKSPDWFGVAQKFGEVPSNQTQNVLNQIGQIQKLIQGMGIGQGGNSPEAMMAAYQKTVLPMINTLNQQSRSDAEKYGTALTKGPSMLSADAMTNEALSYPMVAQQQKNIAQNQSLMQALNQLLTRPAGASAPLIFGQ